MVAGRIAGRASTLVAPDEPVAVGGPARAYVSRGGDKLEAALDRFGVDTAGRRCLDAGASTGGFTDCLLRGGAAAVVAVDVGYGQLAWSVHTDPRVTVLERTNVRDLGAGDLPFLPDIVTADLSFISLRLALPPLMEVATPAAEFVLLVKPQFEAGRVDVGKRGVVRDPSVWRRVLESVGDACRTHGVGVRGVTVSPLLGPAGNAEFFMYGRRSEPSAPVDLNRAVAEAAALGAAS